MRLATGSQYDHVAMVIRVASEPREVYLLETSGNLGVHLSRFEAKKALIGSFYSKMVLRQLDWPGKDE